MTVAAVSLRRAALGLLALAAAVAALLPVARPSAAEEEEGDPAEVAVGERLFLETRFAQHFFADSGGDVNARNVPRDPTMDRTATLDGELRGPFRGESMNCRACHLVDEHAATPGGGVRTYADFAVRSPIPDRGDGLSETLRNSPSLVGASKRRSGAFPTLHFDGEFATAEDLVVGTWTGRNFGWLPAERDDAIHHVARVIRRDDGTGALAREFGGSYSDVLSGKRGVPSELRLPARFRIDVRTASDERVVRAAAKIVAAYLRGLDFARDGDGVHVGSAYDAFLRKNRLPRIQRGRESAERYSARLAAALARLDDPKFVNQRDGDLALHRGNFVFGPKELRGLRIFLTPTADAPGATSGVGNCVACHMAPEFTDFAFHSTGVAQIEYDRVHGTGTFAALAIPGLAARDADRDAFLPPTAAHPAALGPFASVPTASAPGRADLGLWNVFLDPDRPAPQAKVRAALVAQFGAMDDAALLDRTIGVFKTPSLRDLGQSSPYFHDGSAAELADAVRQYVDVAELARAGTLRSGDPEIAGIRLSDDDVRDVAAFLASLNEDYE